MKITFYLLKSSTSWSLYIAQRCGCAGVLSIVKSRECFVFLERKKSGRRFKNKKEKPERERKELERDGGKSSWDKQVVSVWWLLRFIITRRFFFGFGRWKKKKKKRKLKVATLIIKMPNYEVVTTVTTIEGEKPQVGKFENHLSKFWDSGWETN